MSDELMVLITREDAQHAARIVAPDDLSDRLRSAPVFVTTNGGVLGLEYDKLNEEAAFLYRAAREDGIRTGRLDAEHEYVGKIVRDHVTLAVETLISSVNARSYVSNNNDELPPQARNWAERELVKHARRLLTKTPATQEIFTALDLLDHADIFHTPFEIDVNHDKIDRCLTHLSAWLDEELGGPSW